MSSCTDSREGEEEGGGHEQQADGDGHGDVGGRLHALSAPGGHFRSFHTTSVFQSQKRTIFPTNNTESFFFVVVCSTVLFAKV